MLFEVGPLQSTGILILKFAPLGYFDNFVFELIACNDHTVYWYLKKQ